MSEIEWVKHLDECDIESDEIPFYAEIEYLADLEMRHSEYQEVISEYNS